jgi:hypothetical protein
MATQNPLLPPGQWVQYNAATQDPRAAAPSGDEKTVGIIKQAFTRSDGPYYQVLWNPGGMTPKSALYHGDQLCAISQQQATEIVNNMNATGQFPSQDKPGSAFQEPNVPIQAVPPSQQQTGQYTL